MEFLSELNEQQRRAATISEGYLRVIAGAGSGKTKLLVSRYAYLVKMLGIDPANILCVTFTNKAAGEMKRRIRRAIGEGYDTSLISTYHGFCARVLRDDCEKVRFPSSFRILDIADQKDIIGDIYEKLELKLDHASFEKILAKISFYKRTPDYVARMVTSEPIRILDDITNQNDRIVEMYLQKQKATFSVDFDDLINFALYIFSNFPEVRHKWQERLNYIQVDEFQDSTRKELQLVEILAGGYGNVMIVGDPDQNIYEWRGSDVKLLVDFDASHAGTQTVFLNQNYRSTPQILACANALIDKNQIRLKKDLFTRAPAGQEVIHYHAKSESDEMRWIAETISDLKRRARVKFSDVAVLYRSGYLSRTVEKVLVENGIPYEIYGGVRFYDRMEIRDTLAYLRLIVYGDDAAFKRIINTPRRKMGRVKLAALVGWQGEGQTLYDTLRAHIDDPVFRGSGAREFVAMVDGLRAQLHELRISELVDATLDRSGYEAYIRELGDMERFDNLSEFKRIAHEYERSFGEQITPAQFLAQAALQTDEEFENESEKVKLMTIHASKGLEFPYVFVIGFSEGTFPSSKTVEERKELGLEEERRLCYVAITRAQSGLYLTDSEGSTHGGSRKLPSRFLSEIGEENYTRIGTIPKDLEEEARRQIEGDSTPDGTPIIGQVLEHPVFGSGTIVSEDARTRTYKVHFDKVGDRNLSREFVTISLFAPKQDKPEPPGVTELPEPPVPPELPEIPAPPEQAAPDEPPRPPKLTFTFAPPEQDEPADETSVEEHMVRVREERELTDDPNETNLWKRSDVPHEGWVCTGITDLGKPVGTCGMCSHQTIRYVHHMRHAAYGQIGAGCICAGQMEGNVERAKQREREFKNLAARRATFAKKQWKQSRNGNPYTKIAGRHVVLYCDKKNGSWSFAVDGEFFTDRYDTKEKAALAAFDFVNR